MQSHGVFSKTNAVSCPAVTGHHCQETCRRASVCSVEFPQCKCSVASALLSSNARFFQSSVQSSFVSHTSHLLVPNLSKSGSRRAKRAAVVSPRAIVATATEVAEVGHNCCFLLPLGLCVKATSIRVLQRKSVSLGEKVGICGALQCISD